MRGSHDIFGSWARLGVLWNAPMARRSPDVEQLIVRSMELAPENPRMVVLVASWLSECWRCVGRDRLRGLALAAPVREQATLGMVLETVDEWLPVGVFGGVYGKLARLELAEPLLRVDCERPALRRLAELEGSALSRRWGLYCLPLERKLDAIRPVTWIMENNPRLRLRSLFKGGLKTSILAARAAGGGGSVTETARECGVTRKAVYEAMDDLKFSGVAGRLSILRHPAGTP